MKAAEAAPPAAAPLDAPRADRERLKPSTFVWLSPAVVLLVVLFLAPVGYAIYLGFTNLELLGPFAQNFSFTGLANLDRMVHDPVFWLSVRVPT
jgi:multiple sugar transport system permease protein